MTWHSLFRSDADYCAIRIQCWGNDHLTFTIIECFTLFPSFHQRGECEERHGTSALDNKIKIYEKFHICAQIVNSHSTEKFMYEFNSEWWKCGERGMTAYSSVYSAAICGQSTSEHTQWLRESFSISFGYSYVPHRAIVTATICGLWPNKVFRLWVSAVVSSRKTRQLAIYNGHFELFPCMCLWACGRLFRLLIAACLVLKSSIFTFGEAHRTNSSVWKSSLLSSNRL